MNIYFGETLKELRLKGNLTQEKLSEFLGVSFQTVSKWERGDTIPDLFMLTTVAAFFDVSADHLLCIDKYNNRESNAKKVFIFQTGKKSD